MPVKDAPRSTACVEAEVHTCARTPQAIPYQQFWFLGYTWQSWFRYLGPKGRRKKLILMSNIYKPKRCGGRNSLYSCTHRTTAWNSSKNWAHDSGHESVDLPLNSTNIIEMKSAVVVSASLKTWLQHFSIWASLSHTSNFVRDCHNEALFCWGKRQIDWPLSILHMDQNKRHVLGQALMCCI